MSIRALPPDLYSRNSVISLLAQRLTGRGGLRVLDVGGYGGELHKFFPADTKYFVLDLKAPPKKDSHSEDEKICTVEYRQSDARKIPFSDKNFDIVIASDIYEHIPAEDRSKILSELFRVTKNFVILGAPFASTMNEKAEEYLCEQFRELTGKEHPFLSEHRELGLPEEEILDQHLLDRGLRFAKIREGNLMNWYIQQLYAGIRQANPALNTESFYTFFNDHLFELGNLRAPTYRTIYCIAKDGMMSEALLQNELQEKYQWKPEVFMEMLKIAFADLQQSALETKTLFEEANKDLHGQVQLLQNDLSALNQSYLASKKQSEETITKARKSLEAHREAINELRKYLQEKETTVNFLKAILVEKDARVNDLSKNHEQLLQEFKRQQEFVVKLNTQYETIANERDQLKTESEKIKGVLREKELFLEQKSREHFILETEFKNHQKALLEVLNSRAWKAVMVYSKIKMGLLIHPFRNLKKAWNILKKQGPFALAKKVQKKVENSTEEAQALNDYEAYIKKTSYSASELANLKYRAEKFTYRPLISIVIPVYNVEEKWLVKAIESVKNQVYDHWEICLTDDASTQSHIKPLLQKYAAEDKRIKVHYREKNGGIVKASNDALKLASGAYIGLLDNDDELSPDALFEVVSVLQEEKYDLIYSDEDKLEMNGTRTEPFFKPDWSPDLLLSCNYICHFGVYRRKIIEEIGGFREGFDGSQDYDLVLRFTEKTKKIKHITKILYHWRKIPGSTAESVDAKPYAYTAAKKALESALKRRNIPHNEVRDGLWKGSYEVDFKIQSEPLVSIIIPFKDKPEILKVCVESVLQKSTYQNFEIILVDNQSTEPETAKYLESLKNHEKITHLKYNEPFNYPAINNFAVQHAKGEMLLLLNNDTEVITPNWIENMLKHALRPEVGAVGARLLYPDNTIQHGGVVVGLGGVAGHAFSRLPKDYPGYCGLSMVVRNFSAVTAACLMMRKKLYEDLGGLDEKNLADGFNDIDLCLRLREKNFRIVYTPFAELYHYEGLTRGHQVRENEVKYMQQRYENILKKGDPFYNPNLTLRKSDFSVKPQDEASFF